MELFSFRKKINKHPDSYQIESITPELLNRLWNCLYVHYFSVRYYRLSGRWENPDQRSFAVIIWDNYLKFPLDSLPADGGDFNKTVRSIFFSYTKYYEIYDFIEICYSLFPKTKFEKCINSVLKEEFAGYSFINGFITQIINPQEIETIEEALTISDEITKHLNTALKLLSSKDNPDYRNSIKESISAVETICRKIVDNPRITLGDALSTIEKNGIIEIHGAEKAAFSSLYGWTSEADGIRHGMMKSPNLDQEDAKFMLIVCSAFIVFLKIKSDKAGIKLK